MAMAMTVGGAMFLARSILESLAMLVFFYESSLGCFANIVEEAACGRGGFQANMDCLRAALARNCVPEQHIAEAACYQGRMDAFTPRALSSRSMLAGKEYEFSE
ncbi:uncharacterized protein UMAG_11639 [Mycosarcoma maydis]|uniref:Uncharacterized protein n=1 Tax=Mycosarcoma maydis TaxID=5270 RepID=A0A0D1CDQ4_MYCMD|nr:uncharacterized protein UMAG_11639 [Ustilago maydis 521]KIS71222.1 hypothetical protein UMAG_11639 [Ustilago maydis 521]|eukprot:XP_011387442.1 hypothetical protein UMAG_11639 [Ustilago maydis 521]